MNCAWRFDLYSFCTYEIFPGIQQQIIKTKHYFYFVHNVCHKRLSLPYGINVPLSHNYNNECILHSHNAKRHYIETERYVRSNKNRVETYMRTEAYFVAAIQWPVC
jgi:hypothetical protein